MLINIYNKMMKRHGEILVVLCFLFINFFVLSLYFVLNAPHDYLQGVYAKIMYIHVPSAWLGMGLYTLLALLSIGYSTTKNPVCYLLAKSVAPVGALLTLATLITGSIWGKPTWGTWWVWDARLTSMLILLFIYFGYIGLSKAYESESKAAAVCSAYAILGLINIPIIKFSVEIWNTLHQPASVLRIGGPTIHSELLIPLIFSAFCLLLFSCILIHLRVRIEYWSKKIDRLSYISK